MDTIQLTKSYPMENIVDVLPGGFYRLAVLNRFVLMRLEWQDAAAVDGKTLIEVSTPVGVILSDFCDVLKFTPEERETALGVELARVTA